MFLRDRPGSRSIEPLRATEEIQPRAELPTNRLDEPLARKFRSGVELRHSSDDPRCRDEGQSVRNTAKSTGRLDDTVVEDGAGASFQSRVLGDLEKLGQHAHRFR